MSTIVESMNQEGIFDALARRGCQQARRGSGVTAAEFQQHEHGRVRVIDMDTSKEYVDMCEKAQEIQKSWKPCVGDWFLNDYRGTTGFDEDIEKQIWGDDDNKWEVIQCLSYKPSISDYVQISSIDGHSGTYTMQEFFKHRHVWLPRQDQLQDMLPRTEPYRLFSGLYGFGEQTGTEHSPDELTLKYVMKTNFSKTWDWEKCEWK